MPITHPLVKTATDIRRSVNRLLVFAEQNPTDELVVDGVVMEIVMKLKEARRLIPKDMWDTDLVDA